MVDSISDVSSGPSGGADPAGLGPGAGFDDFGGMGISDAGFDGIGLGGRISDTVTGSLAVDWEGVFQEQLLQTIMSGVVNKAITGSLTALGAPPAVASLFGLGLGKYFGGKLTDSIMSGKTGIQSNEQNVPGGGGQRGAGGPTAPQEAGQAAASVLAPTAAGKVSTSLVPELAQASVLGMFGGRGRTQSAGNIGTAPAIKRQLLGGL